MGLCKNNVSFYVGSCLLLRSVLCFTDQLRSRVLFEPTKKKTYDQISSNATFSRPSLA